MRFGSLIAHVVFVGCTLIFAVDAAQAAQVPPRLLPLLQNKEKIALALSEPAARCVQRKDTKHPAFHGCIDWHSAVHGTWALVAYTAMTGDGRYESLIKDILQPKHLDKELRFLQSNTAFELPYGRAWFLRLALEYERHYRDGKLLPMGDFVASTLLTHYTHTVPDPRSPEYESSSWAIINLLDFYEFRSDKARVKQIKGLAKARFLGSKPECDSSIEQDGFMAICTNWAWLASKIMGQGEFNTWVTSFMPPSRLPKPITDPRTAHEHGLNFSRSWGLWEMFSVAVRPEYIDSYVDHVQATLKNRSNWDGDYGSVGHWVPQFGMFAIQPLFGSKFR